MAFKNGESQTLEEVAKCEATSETDTLKLSVTALLGGNTRCHCSHEMPHWGPESNKREVHCAFSSNCHDVGTAGLALHMAEKA